MASSNRDQLSNDSAGAARGRRGSSFAIIRMS
jgi:hypothetical protein